MTKTETAKKRRRAAAYKSAYRVKFALCAKLCRGDSQCMSRCLKSTR